MSRLVHEFPNPLVGPDGKIYTIRARGEETRGGHWEGWIEYLPQGGGPAHQTGRETAQSNYEQLAYWASGLTPTYLEMAMERAGVTASEPPEPPPPLEHALYDPARIRELHEDSSVVRIEVETLDPALPRKLVQAQELAVGRFRRIPGAGILVYDGVDAEEGRPSRHAFLAQFGSGNASAVLANHLWSDLHGEGATLRIEGRAVEIDNHEIHEALRGRLPAARDAPRR